MNCIFCNKRIENKGGLIKHQNGCNKNPNKILYKCNFIDYNNKIKNGEIIKPFSNQWQKAKKLGTEVILSSATRFKLGSGNRGKTLSKEKKEHLSVVMSKIIEESGGGGFKHVKWYKLKNILGEEFILRGSLELSVGNLLNESNILWVRKKYISYTDEDGIKRTYCPDFYISEIDRFLEIKGYFSENDKKKLQLVINQNNVKLLLVKKENIDNTLIKNIYADVSPLAYIQ